MQKFSKFHLAFRGFHEKEDEKNKMMISNFDLSGRGEECARALPLTRLGAFDKST